MPNPSPLHSYIDDLQRQGRYTFTRSELASQLEATPTALKNALRRLATRGRIVRLRRGFYVIVPLEHQASGILGCE